MDEQSHIISLNKSFKACKLSASTESLTSFFVDSSGRSSFLTDLDLVFDSKHDLEALLAINCFHPPPLHRIQQEEALKFIELTVEVFALYMYFCRKHS